MDCRLPGFSVHGFSRQEFWSGLPFPSPGYLPNPGIESRSPALWADTLPSEPPGKLVYICVCVDTHTHTRTHTHTILFLIISLNTSMVLGKVRTKGIHLVGGYELNKYPPVIPLQFHKVIRVQQGDHIVLKC